MADRAIGLGLLRQGHRLIELLRSYFAIESRDDPRKIREKVTGKVLTLAPALGPAVPALLALLDVPVDEASWQAERTEANPLFLEESVRALDTATWTCSSGSSRRRRS